MIRLLKAFVEWLDRRFPAKFVITEQHFNQLDLDWGRVRTEVNALSRGEKMAFDRIDKLEKSLVVIKDLLTKGQTIAADKRRADFVATGRMAE